MRWGGYGSGRKVKSDTVATALSSVGKEISLAIEVNPVKLAGSERMVPRLAQTLDGWRKEDGPVMKKLPVEADVPELLVKLSLMDGSPFVQAVADLATIAFYYLLRIGEYTVKGQRNESKQTRQFKLKDVTFFKRDKRGRLRQLPRTAPAQHIMTADCATLKLDNQKTTNGTATTPSTPSARSGDDTSTFETTATTIGQPTSQQSLQMGQRLMYETGTFAPLSRKPPPCWITQLAAASQ